MQRLVGLLALSAVLFFSTRASSQEHFHQEDEEHQERSESNVHMDAASLDSGPSISIEVVFVDYLGSAGAKRPALESSDQVDEWLQELDGKNRLLSMSRITLGTVEHQQAMAQFGEQAAVATARARNAAQVQRERALQIEQLQQQQLQQQLQQQRQGLQAPRAIPVAVSYGLQDFGTIITATPRLAGDGAILVELLVEKSNISPLNPPLAADDDIAGVAPPSAVRLNTQSTLRLRDGRPQAAYRKSSSSPHGLVETVVLVTASTDEAANPAEGEERPKAAGAPLNIFKLQNADASDARPRE